MSMLGNAPFTLRKRADATWPFYQVSLTVLVSKWMESGSVPWSGAKVIGWQYL